MVNEQFFVAEVQDMERMLYRVARGYLQSADECADAVQEALCKAWNKRHTVTPERFRPWLTRIVINECHNIGRRKKRVQPMAEIELRRPDGALSFDLADELAALSEKLRTPLLLRYLEGFSLEDIAKMSKRIVMMIACILSLCVFVSGSALAQPEPLDAPRCAPEAIDLSGVQMENGRLTGVLRLPESAGVQGEVRVDCPVPQAFPAELAQTLQVRYKSIDENSLKSAMESIGQSTKDGELKQWANANQSMVRYSLWNDAEPGNYVRYGLADASLFDDPACAQTYAQAKSMAQSMLAQLGAEAYEPLLHANRYDAAHAVDAESFACYSDADALYQDALESFERSAKKYAQAQRGLTMVNGVYALYGMPVMPVYKWKEEASFMGASSEFHAIVSDDGQLCLFDLMGLPSVEATEPCALPAYTWQEMLSRVAAGWWLGNPHAEDDANVFDLSGAPYTVYATYSVITEIRPCWVGFERGELVPGYYANVEERTVKGDQLISVWSSYGDAETMTLIH